MGERRLGNTEDALLAAIKSAPPERIERNSKYIQELAHLSAREPLETLMKTVLKDAFVSALVV
jgi:hypothetical protein